MVVRIGLLAMLLLGFCSTAVRGGDLAVVGFDVPAIVIAEPVNPQVVTAPTMGGDLMRLRIPVSTFISPEFRGIVSEYVVELESPRQSLRLIDFWPKNESYSDIDGTIAVESSEQQSSQFSFTASGGYEPFARGNASGDFQSKSNQQQRYQVRPPMQILTSSGTIRRGFGVFFKFRPGPQPVLEGAREVAILAEVPRGWRADMLQVSMHAVGHSSASSSSKRTLGSARLWMTTHREGDAAAAALAQRYVAQERALRGLAASQQARIQDRSLPTVWHKLGVALDVIDPRIPQDYLQQIIFGPQDQYFDQSTSRLPVDFRVAVLDYWEQRDALLALTPTSSTRQQHVVSKPRLTGP